MSSIIKSQQNDSDDVDVDESTEERLRKLDMILSEKRIRVDHITVFKNVEESKRISDQRELDVFADWQTLISKLNNEINIIELHKNNKRKNNEQWQQAQESTIFQSIVSSSSSDFKGSKKQKKEEESKENTKKFKKANKFTL